MSLYDCWHDYEGNGAGPHNPLLLLLTMKALALIPDSHAEIITGGFLNTSFGNANANTINQTNNVGNTGIALLGVGNFRLRLF